MNKNTRLTYIIPFWIFVLALLEGSGLAAPLQITVSVAPQAYIVSEIGGSEVSVQVLASQNSDPHIFQPSPRQVTALSQSAVYFSIGLPFEQVIIEKMSKNQKNLKIIDMARGIAKIPYEAAHHAHETAHSSIKNGDPHVWMDPALAIIMAQNIADTLSELNPQKSAFFAQNLARFKWRLHDVDAKIKAQLAPYRGQSFLVFHPSYSYFARAYGLTQVALEFEGKEPTPQQLQKTISLAREKGIQVVFVGPQLSQKSARALASAIGGVVTTINDLASNIPANLAEIADKIESALKNNHPKK